MADSTTLPSNPKTPQKAQPVSQPVEQEKSTDGKRLEKSSDGAVDLRKELKKVALAESSTPAHIEGLEKINVERAKKIKETHWSKNLKRKLVEMAVPAAQIFSNLVQGAPIGNEEVNNSQSRDSNTILIEKGKDDRGIGNQYDSKDEEYTAEIDLSSYYSTGTPPEKERLHFLFESIDQAIAESVANYNPAQPKGISI